MKKIYIKEDKLKLLKESNSPDQVIYNSEVLEYYDSDAFAFIVNEIDNKVIVTIAEDYGFPHNMIKNNMASKLMGFEGYSHFLKYIQDNEELYDDLYGELESKINDVCKTITYEGRYWRDNEIIVFWDNTPSRNVLGEILKQINNSLNISIDDTIVVIRDSFIPFREYHFNDEINNEEFDENSYVSDKDLRAIHLMNQQDKREALTDFRQNRGEVQGKKLGKMPMAQYHSLIYQEEKDVFNWGNYFSNLKRIDENIKESLNIILENSHERKINSLIKSYFPNLEFNDIRKVRANFLNIMPNARSRNEKWLYTVLKWYLDGDLPKNECKRLNNFLGWLHNNQCDDLEINNSDWSNLPFLWVKQTYDKVLPQKDIDVKTNNLNTDKVKKVSNFTIRRIDNNQEAMELGRTIYNNEWCILNGSFDEQVDDCTCYIIVNNKTYDKAKPMSINNIKKILKKNNFNDVLKDIEGCNDIIDISECSDKYFKIANVSNGLPPYDSYGTSAMVLLVGDDGGLYGVYSRYNIPNMCDGTMFDETSISQFIKQDIHTVCPYVKK